MLLSMAMAEVSGFGTMPDGTSVEMFTVGRARFIGFGARVVGLEVADARGKYADVVLGFRTLDEYLEDESFQGATIGRFGNRIAGGKFELDGVEYSVPLNDGGNALHGGREGFDRRVWAGEAIEDGVEFRLVSADGDQGLPGALTVRVRYTFAGDALRIEYRATTDKATVVNLTNHSYFNLAGEGTGTVLGHEISIDAERFTPVNAALIPTGQLREVAGTVFDLRKGVRVGECIDVPDEQVLRAGGWDHNWVLGRPGVMKAAARVTDPVSGRWMTVETTEPGLQFYSGNFLDGSNGYERRTGFCLETQHYPDSPNQKGFPSVELRPGEVWRSETVYRFGAGEMAV